MAHPTSAPFDPADPHGFGEAYHEEHHVSSLFSLVVVLIALLFFTVLTVGQAVAEGAIAQALGIDIPHWVNIAVVMTIAVIKGTLVALYFMHLRHDNRLNAVIFISCLAILALFLGLTMIDLDRRTTVYEWKDTSLLQGGTQHGLETSPVDLALGLSRNNTSIVQFARDRYVREHGAFAWFAQHPDNLAQWLAHRAATPAQGDRYAAFWHDWLQKHGPANAASITPEDAARWAQTTDPRAFFAAMRKAQRLNPASFANDATLLFSDIDWTWADQRGTDAWLHDPDNHHPLAHGGHDDHPASDANRSRPQHWDTIEPWHEPDEQAPAHQQGH